jgi:hypothetical protein
VGMIFLHHRCRYLQDLIRSLRSRPGRFLPQQLAQDRSDTILRAQFEGFIAPVFTGAFASPFIGPNLSPTPKPTSRSPEIAGPSLPQMQLIPGVTGSRNPRPELPPLRTI